MKLKACLFIVAFFLCSCMPHPVAEQIHGKKLTALEKESKRSSNLYTDSIGKTVISAPQVHTTSAKPKKHTVQNGDRTIDAFLIHGNARIPTAKIQSQLQQYLGVHKSDTDVSNAMRSVIDLYSSSGLNGAIVTKHDHVVVLDINESSIGGGTATGSGSISRHYSTGITVSLPGTAQPPITGNDIQTMSAFSGAGIRAAIPAGAYFIIHGNHLVSTEDIQQVLKPYVGKHFTRNKLFLARKNIIDIYERRGFFNVAVGLPASLRVPVVLTVFENDIDKAAVKIRRHSKALARLSSNWVRLGWQEVGQGKIKQAMAIWQRGVNRMPPDQLLAFIGIYTQESAAIRRLEQIGVDQSAIMLKMKFHNRPAYYVMSARHVPENKVQRHKKLAGLRRAMGIHGRIYASSAGKFQTSAMPHH